MEKTEPLTHDEVVSAYKAMIDMFEKMASVDLLKSFIASLKREQLEIFLLAYFAYTMERLDANPEKQTRPIRQSNW